MDKQIVEIYIGVHGTTMVEIYNAQNNNTNSFFTAFDVWGGGQMKLYDNDTKAYFLCECDKDFYEIAKTKPFETAFKRLKIDVVFLNNERN